MMDTVCHLAGACCLGVAPMERWRATRNALESPGNPWLWQALLLILLAVLAAGLIWLHLTQRRRKQRLWADFQKQANDRGLDTGQRQLLKELLAYTNLKCLSTIFTLEAAFDYGAARHRRSAALGRMSQPQRDAVTENIDALRRKMGFQDGKDTRRAGASSRDIAEGACLSVLCPGHDAVEAVVVSSNAVGMSVQPSQPVDWRTGDTLHVQFTRNGQILEFQTTVLQMRHEKVSLNHSGEVRPANRRRFPHVPVQYPARIAYLPFHKTDPKRSAPFHNASVVEMAGPGLRLQSPISLHPGQRVLVELYLHGNKVVQGAGRVLRVEPGDEPQCVATVELVALTDAETDELIREANAAARRSRAEKSPPNPPPKPLRQDHHQSVS